MPEVTTGTRMADPVRRLISEQRSRLVATLLTHLEPRLKPLGDEEWQESRKAVMDAVGVYHDVVLDALKVSRDGTVSDDVVDLIRELHRGLERRIDAAVNGRSV